jgi:hypothetical protein
MESDTRVSFYGIIIIIILDGNTIGLDVDVEVRLAMGRTGRHGVAVLRGFDMKNRKADSQLPEAATARIDEEE